MNFVDRIEETARLRDALSREKSSLVVVYGRRRLGKSTLIKRVLSDSDVYFLADRSEGQHQRILLAKVVAQVFPDFDNISRLGVYVSCGQLSHRQAFHVMLG